MYILTNTVLKASTWPPTNEWPSERRERNDCKLLVPVKT